MSGFDLADLQSTLKELAPQGRSGLLPALHAAQAQYGFIPEPAAVEIGRALGVPLVDIYGVIEFYSMFYTEPTGKKIVRVCTDPACALSGGEAVLESLCRRLGVAAGETSPDGNYTIERATCLGLCEHAPAALVGEKPLGDLASDDPEQVLRGSGPGPRGVLGGDLRILTANCGKGRPRPSPAPGSPRSWRW